MNEHQISIHVNKNSRILIVQDEFTTWTYIVNISFKGMDSFDPVSSNAAPLFPVWKLFEFLRIECLKTVYLSIHFFRYRKI